MRVLLLLAVSTPNISTMARQGSKDYTVVVQMDERRDEEDEQAKRTPDQPPKTPELEQPFDDEFWQEVSYTTVR